MRVLVFFVTLLGSGWCLPLIAASYYVATYGSPNADGSFNNPFSSVNQAFNNPSLAYGDTIFIRGGTYREPFELKAEKNLPGSGFLTIQNYGGEEVIFKGSRTVTGWVSIKARKILANNATDKLPYPLPDNKLPKDELGSELGFSVWSVNYPLDSARPQPQQVFFTPPNGPTRCLRQLGWSSRLSDWVSWNGFHWKDIRPPIADDWMDDSFFYYEDGANSKLFVLLANGENPNGGTVEVSRDDNLFWSYKPRVSIQGIKFSHSNGSKGGTQGAINSLAEDSRLVDCEITWMDLDAVSVGGGSVILRCIIANNGKLGCSLGGPGCWFTQNLVCGNNYRGFVPDNAAGGMKCIIANGLDMSGSIIAESEFCHNHGPGIWMDTIKPSSARAEIVNNFVHDNSGAGIFLENCAGAFDVHANVVANNRGDAVSLHSANESTIEYNTIIVPSYASTAAVAVQLVNTYPSCGLNNNLVRGNICVGYGAAPLLQIQTSSSSGTVCDYNYFYKASTGDLFHDYDSTRYGDIASWQSASSLDGNSVQANFAPFQGNASGAHAFRIQPLPMLWQMVYTPEGSRAEFDHVEGIPVQGSRTEPGAFAMPIGSDGPDLDPLPDNLQPAVTGVFVDGSPAGSDQLSGYYPAKQNAYHGPKRTIVAGLATCWAGASMYVAQGIYSGDVDLTTKAVTMVISTGTVSLR